MSVSILVSGHFSNSTTSGSMDGSAPVRLPGRWMHMRRMLAVVRFGRVGRKVAPKLDRSTTLNVLLEINLVSEHSLKTPQRTGVFCHQASWVLKLNSWAFGTGRPYKIP